MGVRLDDRTPGGRLQDGGVGPVAVDDEDLPEAVMGHAFRDVHHEVLQVVVPHGDRPGEVHVVVLEPVGQGRQDQHLVGDELRRAFAHAAHQVGVHVQGHVIAVVLRGPDGQDDGRLLLHLVLQFDPGVVVVAIGQAWTLHKCSLRLSTVRSSRSDRPFITCSFHTKTRHDQTASRPKHVTRSCAT